MKRIEFATIYGQFLVLPSIGFLYRANTTYKPRLAIAWLFWGVSIGFGRKE